MNKYLVFLILTVLLNESLTYLTSDGLEIGAATEISLFFRYLAIYLTIYYAFRDKFRVINSDSKLLIFSLLLYYLLQFIRGFFIANNYWEFKNFIFNVIPYTLLFVLIFIGSNVESFFIVSKLYLRRIVWVIFIESVLLYNYSIQLFSRLTLPLYLMFSFIPFVKRKYVFLIISFSIFAILINLEFRFGIVKLLLSTVFLIFYYFGFLKRVFFVRSIYIFQLLIPPLFFVLGVLNIFNPFRELTENESFDVNVLEESNTSNLGTDTRTFLFVEVLHDLQKSDCLLFGKGPSKGYDSYSFIDDGGAVNGIRYSTEVYILNILLYFGVFGAVLILLFIQRTSYLAVFDSKNDFCLILGFLVNMRVMFFFIEEYTKFDFNFMFFWLFCGLILNDKFRKMSNEEVKSILLNL